MSHYASVVLLSTHILVLLPSVIPLSMHSICFLHCELQIPHLFSVTNRANSCYRQDCRIAANCRYCFYHRPNPGFSPRRGDSLHRFRSNFAGPTGTWVRLAVQNFTSIGAEGWECGPKISKICTFW